jgi:hypothetical protein
MKKFMHLRLILFSVCLIFLFGCGRKQKNIFHFSSDKTTLKVSKLSLPAVKGLKIQKTKQGNLLFWQDLSDSEKNRFVVDDKIEIKFVGYNVYRLVKSLFVPKKAVNQLLIKENQFLDDQIFQKKLEKESNSYLVRAVFKFQDKNIQGPASQIVFAK